MRFSLVYDANRERLEALQRLLAHPGSSLTFVHEASAAIGHAGDPDLAAVIALDGAPGSRAVEVLDMLARGRSAATETLLLSDDPTAGGGRHRRLPLGAPLTLLAELVDRTARAAAAEHEAAELRQKLEAHVVRGLRRERLLDAVVQERTRGLERAFAELRQAHEQLRDAHRETIRVLSEAIEAKDRYTKGHCSRVAAYSVALARAKGVPEDQLEAIELAGFLHDIGKLGVREDVLNKSGSLDETELVHVRHHPDIGWRIARQISALRPVLPAIRNHHERWDGQGYPDGLAGDGIPLAARIVCLTDAFDAMATDRPYRARLSIEECLANLRKQAGRMFDPELVELFIGGRLYALCEPDDELAGTEPPGSGAADHPPVPEAAAG